MSLTAWKIRYYLIPFWLSVLWKTMFYICVLFLVELLFHIFSTLLWFALSYGVQQATIWALNVVSVTEKASALYQYFFFFLVNHGCHYHYCWCSILFWSLDSGPAMIKNQIYSPVQSGAPVVPAKPAVLPALLLRSSNPANVYFRRLCLHSNIAVTWKFNHPVGGAHMNILLL